MSAFQKKRRMIETESDIIQYDMTNQKCQKLGEPHHVDRSCMNMVRTSKLSSSNAFGAPGSYA